MSTEIALGTGSTQHHTLPRGAFLSMGLKKHQQPRLGLPSVFAVVRMLMQKSHASPKASLSRFVCSGKWG